MLLTDVKGRVKLIRSMKLLGMKTRSSTAHCLPKVGAATEAKKLVLRRSAWAPAEIQTIETITKLSESGLPAKVRLISDHAQARILELIERLRAISVLQTSMELRRYTTKVACATTTQKLGRLVRWPTTKIRKTRREALLRQPLGGTEIVYWGRSTTYPLLLKAQTSPTGV